MKRGLLSAFPKFRTRFENDDGHFVRESLYQRRPPPTNTNLTYWEVLGTMLPPFGTMIAEHYKERLREARNELRELRKEVSRLQQELANAEKQQGKGTSS